LGENGTEQIEKLRSIFIGLGVDVSVVTEYLKQYEQELANANQLAQDAQEAGKLGFDIEEYKDYVAYLQRINENLRENQELADETALSNMRLNRGVESLIDNMED